MTTVGSHWCIINLRIKSVWAVQMTNDKIHVFIKWNSLESFGTIIKLNINIIYVCSKGVAAQLSDRRPGPTRARAANDSWRTSCYTNDGNFRPFKYLNI